MRSSSQRSHLLYIAVASLMLAGSTIAGAFVSLNPKTANEYVGLTLLGLACVAPAVISLFRQRFDPFEPIHAFALSTFVYFAFIPANLLWQASFTLLGVDYSAGVNDVTVLAFLALVGFVLGYYWKDSKRLRDVQASNDSIAMSPEQRQFLRRWATLIFLCFLALMFLWIIVARIPLAALWIFGEASYSDAWEVATGPQIGYLYGARDALPACLLLLITYRSGKRWRASTILLLIFVTLFFAGFGARFRVLVLVISVVLFRYLEIRKRPRLWQSALVAFVIFYFVIGGIGFYRSYDIDINRLRGRAIGEDSFQLNDAWEIMLDSSQIAVSTALLVRVVPESTPYFLGASFLNFFTQPIPRFLWEDKPKAIGQEFFDSLWPPGTTLPFWAIFYLNFGPVAIVPAMMLWGWASRKIYDAWRVNPGNGLTQVQLAVYWPFVIHMYGRGGDNFAFNVYGLIFVLAPVWMIAVFARVRTRRMAKAMPSPLVPAKS